MNADGSREPEFCDVRFNERGEVEFYDGTTWKTYADVAAPDWDELPVVRSDQLPVVRSDEPPVVRESPVIHPGAEDAAEGPEPG
jgi:hypothetical protein